jgi:ABC-type tungstate transport system permease subunit
MKKRNPEKKIFLILGVILWSAFFNLIIYRFGVIIYERSIFSHPQKTLKLRRPKKPEVVKGIHLTGWVISRSTWFKKYIELVKRTQLNALVIDIKEADGWIFYHTDKVPLAKEIGSTRGYIKDIKKVVKLCRENNIYPIARIVVFKDHLLARAKPSLALKTRDGELWRDKAGKYWVSPYQKRVWLYNLRIAKDAAEQGFAEIQFDYVRFPDVKKSQPSFWIEGHSQARAVATINEFVRYVSRNLARKGVKVSVDVFGLTTTAKDDLGIGQKFEGIVKEVDYICPMIYPSHYWENTYGIPNPNEQPYQTVFFALREIFQTYPPKTLAKVQPWLQDFSLGYQYTHQEVLAQIKACYHLGINSWYLWNPRCRYTQEAFSYPPVPLTLISTLTLAEAGVLTTLIQEFEKRFCYKVNFLISEDEKSTLEKPSPRVSLFPALANKGNITGNDVFVTQALLVGPRSDPAEVRKARSILESFRKIYQTKSHFISTPKALESYQKELSFWQELQIQPSSPWYLKVLLPPKEALSLASQKEAYILVDEIIFYRFREKFKNLRVLSRKEKRLEIKYRLNFTSSSQGNRSGREFYEFLTSPYGRRLLREAGVETY